LIVGLGNPGEPYCNSRHNIGFHVVDWFRAAFGFPQEISKLQVTCTEKALEGERIVLVKPQSFMNLSGLALRDFLEAEALLPEALGAAGERSEAPAQAEPARLQDWLLVVHDDLDLPFGKLRFKARGASGGHRGVDSLIEALGRDSFSRLKVGIGRIEGTDARDYVLEPLEGEDRESLREAAARAGKTLAVWIREGVQACASQFNGPDGEMKAES